MKWLQEHGIYYFEPPRESYKRILHAQLDGYPFPPFETWPEGVVKLGAMDTPLKEVIAERLADGRPVEGAESLAMLFKPKPKRERLPAPEPELKPEQELRVKAENEVEERKVLEELRQAVRPKRPGTAGGAGKVKRIKIE
ncbi:hypothetical protein JCM10908_000794 [Rhodotorula pacifica]|uniref:uncharacterized protein n=1 Tax=Rhodotorula pacifica TaxID=1495444 RepID=UPI00316B20D8